MDIEPKRHCFKRGQTVNILIRPTLRTGHTNENAIKINLYNCDWLCKKSLQKDFILDDDDEKQDTEHDLFQAQGKETLTEQKRAWKVLIGFYLQDHGQRT